MSDEKENDFEVLELSLAPAEKPVILKGSNGKEKCSIVEMMGPDRDRYLGGISNNVKFNNKGKVSGLKSYKGVQAKLIYKCLQHEYGEPFTIEEVQEFPASVQNTLFEICQKMNGLDEDAEDDAKND